MAQTDTAPVNTTEQLNSFPISLALDEFQAAVLDVFVHYMRTIGRMTDEKNAWGVSGLPVPDGASLFDPDNGAAELGLTYEHIRRSDFVRDMKHLYEFGFLGRLDESADSMVYESSYMWVSDIVCDAAYGYVAHEWDTYGGGTVGSARRCVLVAELANARNMLEGGESFSNFRGDPARPVIGRRGSRPEGNAVSDDSLTVRQMALLAGMEEMSIRAAANPKRPKRLKTHIEDGGTRIAFDVAKAWLQSKGRYVPITRYWAAGEVDLATRRFTSSSALIEALDARRKMIAARDGDQDLNDRLAGLGVPVEKSALGDHWSINEPHLHEQLMRPLAELFELPSDLLVMRTHEMLAIQQLSRVERQLREATAAKTERHD